MTTEWYIRMENNKIKEDEKALQKWYQEYRRQVLKLPVVSKKKKYFKRK